MEAFENVKNELNIIVDSIKSKIANELHEPLINLGYAVNELIQIKGDYFGWEDCPNDFAYSYKAIATRLHCVMTLAESSFETLNKSIEEDM